MRTGILMKNRSKAGATTLITNRIWTLSASSEADLVGVEEHFQRDVDNVAGI
jgi:hypothetical protein